MPIAPNFFIVGAPKCGTTALYEYLRLHPNIFMSAVKEPHFFARDLGRYPSVQRLEDYRALFAESTSAHLAVGEASVYYLRSVVAIPNIQMFNPQARIIVMLRNPVEMVYSLHAQLLYVAEEDVLDFETAWRLQERRRQGIDLPRTCREPQLLEYHQVGCLGRQVQRLLSRFPAAQVKLILFEDFTASPKQVYREVLDFLGVPDDGRTEFPRINESKKARFEGIKSFLRRPPPVLHRTFRGMKRVLGAERLAAFKAGVVELNTVREERPPLSEGFRAELIESFRDDIAVLSRTVQRDLRSWTQGASKPAHDRQNTVLIDR